MIADRRADYAVMLASNGQPAAAGELMSQALDLVPGWAAGWFLMAGYCEKAGEIANASTAYRAALALAPGDIFGAGLKLALMGEMERPDLPPSLYVEGLFDDYADTFDHVLVERLFYQVPQKLKDLIVEHFPAEPCFDHVVDLGCGTGLFGAQIKPWCRHLEGWDLSTKMLAKASDKQIYHHLGQADLSRSPSSSGLFADLGKSRADLVCAADVMIYLGDLDKAFTNIRQLVRPGGIVAFSVEKAQAREGFSLLPSMRFCHSRAHIEGMLHAHGMRALSMRQSVIRRDADQPVTGLLFLAEG